ncbi:hypothetical protein [Actinomadura roseirufa]|uniref:hypothetical protein n=1 Tax=Actinomadura roseirufa TaxID=2094049 RepID=UPI00104115F9|nr:hypothetical protein [Actinomadura roseirufa]
MELSRWIADVDAQPEEAPGLARGILAWLVEAEVVVAEPTDCVLGDVPGGYAPGPSCGSIVVGGGGRFPDVWPNGLELDVGRSAFYGPVAGDTRVTCSNCDAWLPFEAVLPVVEEWLEGGPDALVCACCAVRRGFNEWLWPVPCAFAELGLRFWNWPPLADAFVADLARRLGHRLVAGAFGV